MGTAILGSVPRSAHVAKFIRFPVEIAQRIEAIAKRERRTFTAQLLLMLEQWLEQHPDER
jgi:predicted DNA-binding protein